MNNEETRATVQPQPWRIVRWVVIAQILLASVMALAIVFIVSPMHGVMAMLGGLMTALMTVAFAFRAFWRAAQTDAKAVVGAMYRAEALKMAIATLFFTAVALWLPDYFGSIVLGFAAATLSYWLALPLTARAIAVPDANSES